MQQRLDAETAAAAEQLNHEKAAVERKLTEEREAVMKSYQDELNQLKATLATKNKALRDKKTLSTTHGTCESKLLAFCRAYSEVVVQRPREKQAKQKARENADKVKLFCETLQQVPCSLFDCRWNFM